MGEEGLEELRYKGKAGKPLKWPGPVTRFEYEFGGDKKVGFVDVRDAERMKEGPFEPCR